MSKATTTTTTTPNITDCNAKLEVKGLGIMFAIHQGMRSIGNVFATLGNATEATEIASRSLSVKAQAFNLEESAKYQKRLADLEIDLLKS